MIQWKIKEFIIFTSLLQQIVGTKNRVKYITKILITFSKFSISESGGRCLGCKEKVKIEWLSTRPNVVLKMKINKLKSKIIELEKSPLVLEPYDPNNRDTCIFEGYWDANKFETPITVLGCPNGQEIEVRCLLE